MTPEGKVKSKVRGVMHDLGFYTFPVNQGGIGRRGIPDDFFILQGKPAFIEFKAECRWDKNNKSALATWPTPLQLTEMDAIRNHGGYTFMVDKYNADDFTDLLSDIRLNMDGTQERIDTIKWDITYDDYRELRDMSVEDYSKLFNSIYACAATGIPWYRCAYDYLMDLRRQ